MLLFYFFNKFFYSESIPVIRTAGTGIFQKQYMGGLKKFQPGQIGDGTCYIRYIIRKNKKDLFAIAGFQPGIRCQDGRINDLLKTANTET